MKNNIYKNMMMKNFINASIEIMSEEGIEGITIRKVAAKVSVNSATIYNHFDNLEHLKVFSCLLCFDEYINDIESYLDDTKDLEYNYKKIWECFINHTIDNIPVFYTLFFNSLEKDLGEYIKEYYEIFPIKNKNYNNSIISMLNKASLEKRNEILLEEMSKLGMISSDRVSWINDMSVYTYESILHRIYTNKVDPNEGAKKIYSYICSVLEENLIKNSEKSQ